MTFTFSSLIAVATLGVLSAAVFQEQVWLGRSRSMQTDLLPSIPAARPHALPPSIHSNRPPLLLSILPGPVSDGAISNSAAAVLVGKQAVLRPRGRNGSVNAFCSSPQKQASMLLFVCFVCFYHLSSFQSQTNNCFSIPVL